MQGLVGELIESIFEVPGAFAEVAANDPFAAVLLGVGFLILAVASGIMGYLSLGAAVEFVMPS